MTDKKWFDVTVKIQVAAETDEEAHRQVFRRMSTGGFHSWHIEKTVEIGDPTVYIYSKQTEV